MLGESTMPGPLISSRKTVVIRFGEFCAEDTSPCGLAGGEAEVAAKAPNAPRDKLFPKSRRDTRDIWSSFKPESKLIATLVALTQNKELTKPPSVQADMAHLELNLNCRPLAWIIHDLSGEKRKDALKG
jgi:hypothetical protein